MIQPREWIHYIKWRIKKFFERRKFVDQRP